MSFCCRYIMLVLVLTLPSLCQEMITGVSFKGLQRTNSEYLQQIISSLPGTRFDTGKLKKDQQQLLNSQMFMGVDTRVVDSTGGKWIVFVCDEIVQRIPILNFGGVRDNFWFQVGLLDQNFLGRNGYLSGTYRYYDRHSFETYLELPLLKFPAWGLRANVARLSTLEPAYFSEGQSDYEVRHQIAILGVRYKLSLQNAIIVDFGYLNERYQRDAASPVIGPESARLEKMLFRFGAFRGAVDFLHLQHKGYAIGTALESVKTIGESALFWKLLSTLRFYQPLYRRGTLAVRLRIGISRNEDSPFVPFVLDNYITVRGAGNRVARGTAEVTTNLEYRHNLAEGRNWALQGVAFVDASGWRPPGEALRDIIASRNLVTFVGPGLRLHWFRLNHLVLRADYGISINNVNWRGFVVGVGHYF